ncbi:MAG: TIGR00153 family protein [Candidatus Hydrogenedentes bacterium]|nr:TIGR00153 family protein [Candidatus Hydrogenedentota bacterium]
MFFFSKQKKIESSLAEYRNKVALCVDEFRSAFVRFCETGDRTVLEQDFRKVHKAESNADDIRREIEVLMYSKALFPESRGDILGLIESTDKVANQSENAVQMLLTHHIEIPPELKDGIVELVDTSHRAVGTLLNALKTLFTDFTTATSDTGKIDELESSADRIEAELIDRVFSSDMTGTQKIVLRDLLWAIENISDRAETAGDRIRIIVAKRKA